MNHGAVSYTHLVCGVLYDAKKGKAILQRTVEHHALLEDGDAFSYTMDAEKLISLSMQIYTELLEKAPERPQGVCVTGQMHGIVYADAEGKAVSPLYTWMDMRGNQPRTEQESFAQYYGRLSGYPLKPGYGALTHLYNCLLYTSQVPV